MLPVLLYGGETWILRIMSERSSCGASFGNGKIPDLDFADDAVVFAEMLDILMGALEVLNEESQLLGLWDMNQLLNPANRLACTG